MAPGSHRLEVASPGHAQEAQELVRTLASDSGFGEVEREEIALAVRELAMNLVRHAAGGTLLLSWIEEGNRKGLQIDSIDHGPGIPDPERALVDGYSTAGGLGTGLGTVHRIMDEIHFLAPPEGGAQIQCRRWIRPGFDLSEGPSLVFGAASRPKRGECENGDAFVLRTWPRHALAGVIDGLGHGEFAQRAAQCARAYLEEHFDQPLDQLFTGVDRVCRSTRGVVMALARFELERDTFSFASIGNVEARLSPDPTNFIVRRGILGLNAPKAVVTSHHWHRDCVLVLHSDGLSSHWEWKDIFRSRLSSPEEVAHSLMRTHGKEEDDATILVVRGARDDR